MKPKRLKLSSEVVPVARHHASAIVNQHCAKAETLDDALTEAELTKLEDAFLRAFFDAQNEVKAEQGEAIRPNARRYILQAVRARRKMLKIRPVDMERKQGVTRSRPTFPLYAGPVYLAIIRAGAEVNKTSGQAFIRQVLDDYAASHPEVRKLADAIVAGKVPEKKKKNK